MSATLFSRSAIFQIFSGQEHRFCNRLDTVSFLQTNRKKPTPASRATIAASFCSAIQYGNSGVNTSSVAFETTALRDGLWRSRMFLFLVRRLKPMTLFTGSKVPKLCSMRLREILAEANQPETKQPKG